MRWPLYVKLEVGIPIKKQEPLSERGIIKSNTKKYIKKSLVKIFYIIFEFQGGGANALCCSPSRHPLPPLISNNTHSNNMNINL